MIVVAKEKIQPLRKQIIDWAHRIQEWKIEWHTGIYPGEMATFLGVCDHYNIQSIIECGRGEHAYSTQVLGEYAQEKSIPVVSIDFDPTQGKRFQESLKQYDHLRYVAGDAFDVLPQIVKDLPEPVALLVDGPKVQPANRLLFVASLMFPIRIVAHHNCPLSSPWGREFSRFFPGAFHYEELSVGSSADWEEFKRWEKEWVHSYEAYDTEHGTIGRSLTVSSLAMAVLPLRSRSHWHLFRFASRPSFFQLLALWLKWNRKL